MADPERKILSTCRTFLLNIWNTQILQMSILGIFILASQQCCKHICNRLLAGFLISQFISLSCQQADLQASVLILLHTMRPYIVEPCQNSSQAGAKMVGAVGTFSVPDHLGLHPSCKEHMVHEHMHPYLQGVVLSAVMVMNDLQRHEHPPVIHAWAWNGRRGGWNRPRIGCRHSRPRMGRRRSRPRMRGKCSRIGSSGGYLSSTSHRSC
mmetsp:Transcript_27326/g.73888  ORF Transcript_27326/g.73888 Transcript_27326/m.73888 type:complete len:209 (-) Transcript_27326:300-926(-)